MRHGTAQVVMDLVGDSLRVVVLVTITRIAGIEVKGQIDQVWETYFLTMASQVGIILASVSTFRAFSVSRHQKDVKRTKGSSENQRHWYSPNRRLLKRVSTPSSWRSKAKGQSTPKEYKGGVNGGVAMGSLPEIPRAQMTGVRTFINGCKEWTDTSHIMESRMNQEDDDDWPLRGREHNPEDNV
ncbi:MAG: hypothetical protein Q9225_000483 [Loekoesia sp. 1 TL-2023]